MQIAVIGDGGWGTTLAIHLHRAGHSVKLWGIFPDYATLLNKKRENIKFLPGVRIPKEIEISSELNRVVKNPKLVVLAVPSLYMREVLGRLKDFDILKAKFISATKGIDHNALLRMSEVISEKLGNISLAVLSGPSIAYEVSRGIPTTVVIASKDSAFAKEAQAVFMAERFRVYTSSDVVGVELGGALKNIIAIASGIADGLGFGANSKAAILTRGIQELTRLGVAMGAQRETFSGLSGMGDLITTCMSGHSRNRGFGEEIGKGKRPKDIIQSTEMAIEGYTTTKSAHKLSKRLKVDMPIANEIHEILYNGKDPAKAVKALMTRPPKDEIY